MHTASFPLVAHLAKFNCAVFKERLPQGLWHLTGPFQNRLCDFVIMIFLRCKLAFQQVVANSGSLIFQVRASLNLFGLPVLLCDAILSRMDAFYIRLTDSLMYRITVLGGWEDWLLVLLILFHYRELSPYKIFLITGIVEGDWFAGLVQWVQFESIGGFPHLLHHLGNCWCLQIFSPQFVHSFVTLLCCKLPKSLCSVLRIMLIKAASQEIKPLEHRSI